LLLVAAGDSVRYAWSAVNEFYGDVTLPHGFAWLFIVSRLASRHPWQRAWL
jgi:hypothetical protein